MKRVMAFRTDRAPPDWRERLSEFTKDHSCVAVLASENVVEGMVHVLSAVKHAERAFTEGRNRSRDLAVEVILYLCGERRIERALELAAPGEANVLIVISEHEDAGSDALDSLGLEGRPLSEMTDGTYDALERTALLDLEK
jgi:KEOPS complex subunit Cgi121